MTRPQNTGLSGTGLVLVTDPVLISRYNECLKQIGKPPTQRAEFRIDGIGWSPEIAGDLEDVEYLSQTAANPYAILIIAEQERLPVLVPFHSFDRDLMRTLWKAAGKNIVELLLHTGVWIEMDHDITRYRSPDDLRMIDELVVKTHSVGRLMTAAREQRELVSQLAEGDNWMDASLHDQLRESGKVHGDMRFRNLIVPDTPYTNVRSFYARAFGGVYVFRDCLEKTDVLMILRDPALYDLDRKGVLCLQDPDAVLNRMVKEGVYAYMLRKEDVDDLRALRRTMFADISYDIDSSIDLVNSTSAERKRFINVNHSLFPDYFFDLEMLIKKLEKGEDLGIREVKQDLRPFICRPAVAKEDVLLYELLMLLLTEITLVSIQTLYAYNRQMFIERFKKWSPANQEWAREQLKF